ncbi:MAG: glycosyltransferase family 2 protein [Desulfovibrionaceae bacterium]|nr:glycosyltransferase family 2 protein [Desulfovibrionaceae bacterium]
MTAAPLKPINVAVIILNYQNAPDTLVCLRALAAMPLQPGQIIVVDNNSADSSVEQIMEGWRAFATPVLLWEKKHAAPSLPLDARHIAIKLSVNNGFSAGNNTGIRLALRDPDCAAVWLLNNDTAPMPDALEKLCARLSLNPEAGLAGSTMVYAHDRFTVQCAAGFSLSPWTGSAKFLQGGKKLHDVLATDPAPVEAALSCITGASLLVRRNVLESVGLLPESYFMYCEDTDYGILCARAGFSPAWAKESIVYHKEGGSSGTKNADGYSDFHRPEWVDYLNLRNRIYMMRKHYPRTLPLVLLSCLGVMGRRVRRGQANRLPLVCRAVLDGLRGRMGKPAGLLP